jgi:adenylate cyclase
MLCLRYTVDGEDRAYNLTGDRIRLGRGGDNDIVLSDVSVSRYHAEIRRETGGWVIQDLKSTNGIELNRGPIERAPLEPGDHLSIGVFELAVESLAEVAPGRPRDVRNLPEESDEITAPLSTLTNATIVRPLADFAEAFGLTGKTAPLPPEASDLAYANRMFGFLTRLGRILIEAESLGGVLTRVLDIAFEALPVDRGFILLSDDKGELVCELMRVKDRVEIHPSGEVPVSRTMLRAVMRERVALVTFDAQSDQRLSGGESIRLHQIRAAMCVPVWSGERIIGVMQVDSPFQVGAFVQRDLDFLTTLANYAAVAVERIRYAQQVEQEREMRGRLERYHSPAVIEEVLRRGGDSGGRPRLVQATVLFADLVGFTAFCERSGPEDVAELLNAFLNLSVEAIFRAGGTLDKFIGDCVMAFFGAPVPQEDHALRAARAAVEIQQGLTAWSTERQARGLPGFAARVALNSGPVVVGDIGSQRRVDYTVLGNTVNVAARLESHVARPGDVVVGPETWRLLNGEIPTEALGELQLKGLQQKIQAYRVAGVG